MRTFLLVVVIVTLTLTGCTAGSTKTDGAHRLVIATSTPNHYPYIALSGAIGIDAAGCVVIDKDRVLLASANSRLEGNKLIIYFPGFGPKSYKIGQKVDQLAGLGEGQRSIYVPAGTKCASEKYWLIT